MSKSYKALALSQLVPKKKVKIPHMLYKERESEAKEKWICCQ